MSAARRTDPSPTPTVAPATGVGPSKPAIISAWAVPALVATGFAMVAVVPTTVLTIATFRDARLRAMRWWAVAVAAVYGSGLVLWALSPDPAPSLTKSLHPAHAGLIIAAGIAYAIRYHLARRRG